MDGIQEGVLDWVIDADAHITEPAGLWVDRLPAKWREQAPQMVRGDDGRDRWYVNDGAVMLTVGHTATAGWGAPFPAAPPTFDDVPPAAHDPKARLEYMDSIGVWAQVMYPNVGGFGNQAFLALDDPELQLACVRAYNDWLTEWCSTDADRLLAVTATPFWDVPATVAEIERCAALGHRGILFTGEPQQFGLPLLGCQNSFDCEHVADIDVRVKAFLERPIESSWPYLWIDATYVKVREGGRIVSVAVIIAVAVNTDGRREVLGMAVGASEAEPFWTKFLRSLTSRGLRGVKLVISDAHEGLKAAAKKVLRATWQRCRVHFMRNALANVHVKQRGMVAAAIRTAFTQETEKVWRGVQF